MKETFSNTTMPSSVNGVGTVQGPQANGETALAQPIPIGAKASSVAPAALTAGQIAELLTNLYNELVTAGYTWATNSNRTEEINPLNDKHVTESLVDTTDVAATAYYPSSLGASMDGFDDLTLTGKVITDTDTNIIELQVTDDEDPATADWVSIYGYDAYGNAMANTVTAASATVTFAWVFENLNFKYFRVKYIVADVTNTTIIKMRRKAL